MLKSCIIHLSVEDTDALFKGGVNHFTDDAFDYHGCAQHLWRINFFEIFDRTDRCYYRCWTTCLFWTVAWSYIMEYGSNLAPVCSGYVCSAS